MAAGREQHGVAELARLGLGRRLRDGPGAEIGDLRDERVARALQLPQPEQPRPGLAQAGRPRREPRAHHQAAGFVLEPRDLAAKRLARGALVVRGRGEDGGHGVCQSTAWACGGTNGGIERGAGTFLYDLTTV